MPHVAIDWSKLVSYYIFFISTDTHVLVNFEAEDSSSIVPVLKKGDLLDGSTGQ